MPFEISFSGKTYYLEITVSLPFLPMNQDHFRLSLVIPSQRDACDCTDAKTRQFNLPELVYLKDASDFEGT